MTSNPRPTMANIAYGSHPVQKLDLYPGAGPGPHRVLLYLHGGWQKDRATKRSAAVIAAPFTQAGDAVIGVGFRQQPDADIPAMAQDIAQATVFVQQNAARLGLAQRPYAMLGHSAGGFLAALLATDSTYLRQAGAEPRDLAAVITLDGLFDIAYNVTRFPNRSRTEIFGTDPAGWPRYAPIAHIDAMLGSPQFCLIHDRKSRRYAAQAKLFAAALAQRGHPVETLGIDDMSHTDMLRRFSDPAVPSAPFAVRCLHHAWRRQCAFN